jgi:hypothetical protein
VSVLTKNRETTEPAGIRGYATQAANQLAPIARNAVPVAQQAVPLARNAGVTFRQGTDTMVARATPLVNAARSWAAPQLEQSARAISENIAPMIAEALVATARKIDVPEQKPRRGPRLLAVSGMLALAASAAAAAMAILRRGGSQGYSSISAVDDGGTTIRPAGPAATQPGSATASMHSSPRGDGSRPEAGSDGTPRG